MTSRAVVTVTAADGFARLLVCRGAEVRRDEPSDLGFLVKATMTE
jgi:hypothetical protein